MAAVTTDDPRTRFAYWRGYPQRYRGLLREEGKRAALGVALLVLLPGGGALAWFVGSAWLPLKLVFGTLLLAIAGLGAYTCGRTLFALLFVRVVPYFEKPMGDAPAFAGGAALARRAEALDRLALAAGVTPLSGFGFADDDAGEKLVWHEPALGLATVRALALQVAPHDAGLRRDLELLADVLGRAAARRIRFALLLRTTPAPSDEEKARRQGAFA